MSVPDNLAIRMVDASTLGDYEVWFFIASLLSNMFVGFLVAWVQSIDGGNGPVTAVLLAVVVMWAILLGIALLMAINKRSAATKGYRDVPLGPR